MKLIQRVIFAVFFAGFIFPSGSGMSVSAPNVDLASADLAVVAQIPPPSRDVSTIPSESLAAAAGNSLEVNSPRSDVEHHAFPESNSAPDASGGVYLGVWQPGVPSDMNVLNQYERETGKHVAIVHWYQGWGAANAPLDLTSLGAVAAHGSVPMITWEPWDYTKGVDQPEYNLATIAGGTFDSYIRSWATGLAAYKGPVLLRIAHEMNSPVYPWSVGIDGNTTGQYVSAWRHVHDIFTAEGASNVQWVWSPDVWRPGQPDVSQTYPGDRYVDWVAMDGYNYVPWGGWRSFTQIFGATYQQLIALTDKPVMIAELASDEAGGSKAAWITNAFVNELPRQFPRVRAVVWFNESREGNWPVDSSAAALSAYSRAIDSRIYRSTWP